MAIRYVISLAAVAWLAPDLVQAQSLCEAGRTNGKTLKANQLYVAGQNGPIAVAYDRSYPTRGAAEFAYYFKSPASGVLAVKVRYRTTEREAPATDIVLRRRNDIKSCRAWNFFDFLNNFETGVWVAARDYANYHITGYDLPSEIAGFHRAYTDGSGRCIRTDQKSADYGEQPNRAQFLFNAQVYAPAVAGQRMVGRQAQAATETSAQVYQAELDHYRAFLRLETHLFTYVKSDLGCVSFRLDHQDDRSVEISINDLEERNGGRRAPERHWKFKLVMTPGN